MKRATELVLSDEYYEKKDKIRNAMQESLEEVDKLSKSIEVAELASLRRDIHVVHIAIFIQATLVFFMIWLTTKLSINPVLDAVCQVKSGMPIPENGSNEFKYLAAAYNKMYEKNKSSFENLSFQVSHDELTGAYNRAGYEVLLSKANLDTTYMLLIDVDDFKNFNDTYGHENGDFAIQTLARAMLKYVKDNGIAARYGGDEFAFAVIGDKKLENEVKNIRLEIEQYADSDPAMTDKPYEVSASLGIAERVIDSNIDIEDMILEADSKMYADKMARKRLRGF